LSTSANLSGQQPAVTGKEVVDQFRGRISVIIDAGETRFKGPSTVILISGNRWKILRQGVLSEHAVRRSANCIILFVCAGNTCRSPLAECICKSLLAEIVGVSIDRLEDNGYTVMSAGISCGGAMPASEMAIQIGREYGIDLTNHLSQRVTKEMLATADRIFVTERHQVKYLERLSGAASGTIELLSTDNEDILDPAGGTLSDYRICASRIEKALRERIDQL
jgi:protein-tyrosine phosphatase